MTSGFIKPELTDTNRGFWDGAAEGVLALQRCDDCAELRYPPAQRCPRCLSSDATWQPISGRGEVLSYVVIHQRYHAAWADRVPYNVALIQLAEGPRMISNVVPLDRPDVSVGMPVQVVFDDEDGLRVPRFIGVDEDPAAYGNPAKPQGEQ
ncbi:Zn-ribbon domain-containing OB-fold protein [Mycolicibacterium wolinskyi]|uniref:Zn-ribbon domain-containing OB-fold protein n=1 Tax=Mycolicibacterium wolinskyi TaxID=59750 RepID=UPI0039177BC8